jgi:hypothetical protein
MAVSTKRGFYPFIPFSHGSTHRVRFWGVDWEEGVGFERVGTGDDDGNNWDQLVLGGFNLSLESRVPPLNLRNLSSDPSPSARGGIPLHTDRRQKYPG